MTGKIKHPALVVCSIQLALIMPVALALLTVSKVAAYSALLGGLLYILPNAYFTAYAFRYSGTDSESAAWVARAIYWAQTGKLALTVVGFAGVFIFVQPLTAPAFIGAYCLMTVSQWFIASVIVKRMID